MSSYRIINPDIRILGGKRLSGISEFKTFSPPSIDRIMFRNVFRQGLNLSFQMKKQVVKKNIIFCSDKKSDFWKPKFVYVLGLNHFFIRRDQ